MTAVSVHGSPVAIVDYGLGNLHNVQRACQAVGMAAKITSSPEEVLGAPAAILPGVGAFGDAIASLGASGVGEALRELVESGRPLFGICLGFQLLMTESFEFGRHRGLDFIPGSVVRLHNPADAGGGYKVPHVGWNRVWKKNADGTTGSGSKTLLDAVADGEYMYFVHSFVVVPAEANAIASTTHYGDVEFCSSGGRGNVFGCQYHPERSGVEGLKLYARFAQTIRNHRMQSDADRAFQAEAATVTGNHPSRAEGGSSRSGIPTRG
jgi:imidazole glycerol-phosphate synthase subunit HisH